MRLMEGGTVAGSREVQRETVSSQRECTDTLDHSRSESTHDSGRITGKCQQETKILDR